MLSVTFSNKLRLLLINGELSCRKIAFTIVYLPKKKFSHFSLMRLSIVRVSQLCTYFKRSRYKLQKNNTIDHTLMIATLNRLSQLHAELKRNSHTLKYGFLLSSILRAIVPNTSYFKPNILQFKIFIYNSNSKIMHNFCICRNNTPP